MKISINKLKSLHACSSGMKRGLEGAFKGKGHDEEVSLFELLTQGCTVGDILWAVRRLDLTAEQEKDFRLLACAFARRVLPIFEEKNPEDKRPRLAIEAAEKFAAGEITRGELRDAAAAADAAAAYAAAAAAYAAYAAAAAADAAAYADADADAAYADDAAAYAAAYAAAAYADADAREEEREAQKEILLELLAKYERPKGEEK